MTECLFCHKYLVERVNQVLMKSHDLLFFPVVASYWCLHLQCSKFAPVVYHYTWFFFFFTWYDSHCGQKNLFVASILTVFGFYFIFHFLKVWKLEKIEIELRFQHVCTRVMGISRLLHAGHSAHVFVFLPSVFFFFRYFFFFFFGDGGGVCWE